MLIELAVKNFKSIEDLRLKLKPLTIFTGPNSSGKSNILESIAILAQAAKQYPESGIGFNHILREGEIIKYPYPPFEFIAHKKDLNRWISFEIHTQLNDDDKSKVLQVMQGLEIPLESITSGLKKFEVWVCVVQARIYSDPKVLKSLLQEIKNPKKRAWLVDFLL